MPRGTPLTGLRLFFWFRVAGICSSMLVSWLLIRLVAPTSIRWLFLGDSFLSLLLALGAAAGLWRYRRQLAQVHGVASLIDWALIALLASQGYWLLGTLVQTFLPRLMPLWLAQSWWLPGTVGDLLCLVLVAQAAHRATGGRGASPLVLGVLAARGLGVVISVIRIFLPISIQLLDLRTALSVGSTVLSGLTMLLLGVLVYQRREQADVEGSAPVAGGRLVWGDGRPEDASRASLAEEPWPTVVSGLSTYRAALLARLVVVVGGAVLLALAAASRSAGMVKALTMGTAAISALIGIWMIAGLVRYARVSIETGARGGASAAVVLGILGLLLDLYSLVLVAQLFSRSLGTLFRVIRQLPWLQTAGQVLGVLAALSLLLSLRQLGRYLGQQEVVSRATRVVVLLGLVIAGNIGVRVLVAARIRGMTAVVVIVGGVVLGLAIWGLVELVRVLDRLGDTLRGGIDDG